LPFNSDISGATDVTKVLIEDLRIEDLPGTVSRYRYSIVLREYKEPPPEPEAPPSQDEQAEEWSEEVAERSVASINVVTGRVLDSEGNPKGGIPVTLISAEGEYGAQTSEEGLYRLEDLPPGRYRVAVDSEEYEGVEEVVVIGGKGELPEERPPEETPPEETPPEEHPGEEPPEEEPSEETAPDEEGPPEEEGQADNI
jgi:hypothetical protein